MWTECESETTGELWWAEYKEPDADQDQAES